MVCIINIKERGRVHNRFFFQSNRDKFKQMDLLVSLHDTHLVMKLATDSELISIHDKSRHVYGLVVVIDRNHKQARSILQIKFLPQLHQS